MEYRGALGKRAYHFDVSWLIVENSEHCGPISAILSERMLNVKGFVTALWWHSWPNSAAKEAVLWSLVRNLAVATRVDSGVEFDRAKITTSTQE